MRMPKNKTTTTIALILMLTMATFMIVMPAAQAQIGPGTKIPTWLLISASPNPVGVGQPVYVSAFMSKPHISATMGSYAPNRVYVNITVEITRPDGTKETYGPYNSDATGGIWFTYVPAKTGNYTLQAFYPGQENTLAPYTGSFMLPSVSEKITLVVQEAPITTYASPPLPTEYWSRPITSINWVWGQELGSHWWGGFAPSFTDTGGYDVEGNVQPYGTAPNTAHILWDKSTAPGGQPSGTIPSDQESQFTSTSIVIRHFEPIIVYGILVYQEWPSASAPSGLDQPLRWIAIDLRTGETLWHRNRGITNAETLKWGQIQKFHSMQEYGCWAALWATGAGSMMYLYDLWTGAHMANVTNVVSGNMLVDVWNYKNVGSILRWYVSAGNLTMWNSTKLFGGPAFSPGGPTGQKNWTAGIQWTFNMTAKYPANTPTSIAVTSVSDPTTGKGVLLMRSAPTPGAFLMFSYGYQVTAGIDLLTGDFLWGPLNQTLPLYHYISLLDGDDGVYVLHDKDTAEAYGYSLENGKLLWGPVKLPNNAWSYIEAGGEIAYGNVYIWDFGGYCTALDLKTGAIKWTFHRGSSGYDAPYGVYPIWHFGSHSVADGKLYFSEGSMYNPPLHPCKRLCINATTGELIWSILSYSGRAPGAIADGMLVEWNSFDNQIYVFGKGQTATTVAASPKISVHGSSVLVEGMVTDESPGTKDPERVARFPHGVPAVSDECMSPWMEYVYMQQPRPTNATGVEVTLDTLDPNSNFVHIGTVTTDTSGSFSYMWTPEVPGKYTVFATFAGSESYWASYAETAIGVEEAPPATPPPPAAAPPPPYELYIIGTGIAIIIAVAIVGLILLRKKP